MKKDPSAPERTSRRQFTRTLVTAAVAAPIAASMAGCKNEPSGPTEGAKVRRDEPCLAKTTVGNGYTEITCDAPVSPEEHIPPMGIDGGGSLIIDSRHKFLVSGSGPYTYVEDSVPNVDRYGDIETVRVVTEMTDTPFVKHVIYAGFAPGTQLLLWYQDISQSPQDPDDTTFPNTSYPPNGSDIRIVGGKGANLFKMAVKRRAFDTDKSHKKGRPNRFKHVGGGGMARHFRIGQWSLVNSAGAPLVTQSGDERYQFYVWFGDYQP